MVGLFPRWKDAREREYDSYWGEELFFFNRLCLRSITKAS